jgi:hypothetical protein
MITVAYSPSNSFIEPGGISRSDFAKLLPKLSAARNEVLADAQRWVKEGPATSNAGFHELPERLLATSVKLASVLVLK